MPTEITITGYTYQELIELDDDSATEKARQWLLEVNTCDDWYEYTLDTWKSALAQVGFPDADIAFSGFYTQGSGAGFKCPRVDVAALVHFLSTPIQPGGIGYNGNEEDFLPWVVKKLGSGFGTDPQLAKVRRFSDCMSGTVKCSQYGYHSTAYVELDTDSEEHYPRVAALAAEFSQVVDQLVHLLDHAIYRDLEEEYEYVCSDEALLELADANEYLFDREGNRIRIRRAYSAS